MSETRKEDSDLSPIFREGAALALKPGDSSTNGSPGPIGRDDTDRLTTPAVELLLPGDRFASVSRLYIQLHRWRVLLGKYWWIPVLIQLLVLLPVWYWTLISPPAYQSAARMWLPGKLDIREGRLYTEELIDYLATQAELLRSPVIQQRALARLTGTSTPAPATLDANSPVRTESTLPTNAAPNRLSESNSISSGPTPPLIPFKVKVGEARKSSILELRAVGAEPAPTRAFLDCLMEEYLHFKKEAREQTSERTVTSVGAQVAELARELEAQQEKLHAFQSSNNVVFLQEQGNSAGNYLAMLNRRLANLRTELSLLRSLLPEQWIQTKTSREAVPAGESSADGNDAKEVLASLAGPQLELFKANQQMQLLKAQRDELSRFLRPLHPKIIKLNGEIETQEKLAQISRDEAVRQMTHRRQAIELEIQTLEAAFEEWDSKAIQASRKIADYDRIRQDLQRLQATYDKMLALIQTVDLSKTIEQENVDILEPASPAKPLNRMTRNMAIAVAGSLLLSFGLVYGIGLFRDDFASVAELTSHLPEKVVGQIPAVSITKSKGRLGLDALDDQCFEFLESFRSIRSWFWSMDHGGTRPRTIIIASAVPEEGKSTVALFLATAMARGNSRVLLIDADMRQSTLHQHFGVASNPGLAEILDRQISLAEAIVPSGIENLALLPAGKASRNPGELVVSYEWNRLLAEARGHYDYILVDTPPVMVANDAAALAPRVDGVLFVVRASFTSARMARRALHLFRQRYVRVLGLIFNRAVSSPYDSNCYARYRRAYGWEPAPAGRVRSLAVHPASEPNGS